jgi:hypothetical protein
VVGDIAIHGRSTSLTVPVEVALEGESATVSAGIAVTPNMLGTKKTAPAKSLVAVHPHFDRIRP